MYDKRTLGRIIEILFDEKRILESMAALEERRCHVLTESSWPNTEAIDQEASALIDKLYALEKERLFAGSQMMHTQDADTLKKLIGFVKPEDREQLLQLQHDMTAVIQRLQFLKSVSEALLKDKQEMIDLTLQAARGESGESEYTEKGAARSINTGATSLVISRRI